MVDGPQLLFLNHLNRWASHLHHLNPPAASPLVVNDAVALDGRCRGRHNYFAGNSTARSDLKEMSVVGS